MKGIKLEWKTFEAWWIRYFVGVLVLGMGLIASAEWVSAHKRMVVGSILALRWTMIELTKATKDIGLESRTFPYLIALLISSIAIGFVIKKIYLTKPSRQVNIARNTVDQDLNTRMIYVEVEVGSLRRQLEMLTAQALVRAVEVEEIDQELGDEKRSNRSPIIKKKCPHCGLLVPESHQCWVIKKKIRCFKCNEANHIALACKAMGNGGLSLRVKDEPDLEAVRQALELLQKKFAKMMEAPGATSAEQPIVEKNPLLEPVETRSEVGNINKLRRTEDSVDRRGFRNREARSDLRSDQQDQRNREARSDLRSDQQDQRNKEVRFDLRSDQQAQRNDENRSDHRSDQLGNSQLEGHGMILNDDDMSAVRRVLDLVKSRDFSAAAETHLD